MSELIDRQALKDYVSSLSTHPLNEWDTWGVIAAIDKQPTVAASPWHRVEEELPEIGQIVLVYDECRRLSICQLDNSYRWLRQGGGWFHGPCACYWMPIEPPKEDA